jgi:hypothetical protein
VVVAAIGDHLVGAPTRPPAFARDGADPVDEGQQLRDVIAMAPGQRCGQRDAMRVDDQVVLGTNVGGQRGTASQQTTATSANVAAVCHAGRPVEPARALSRLSKLAMQPIPDAGCLPIHAAAATR